MQLAVHYLKIATIIHCRRRLFVVRLLVCEQDVRFAFHTSLQVIVLTTYLRVLLVIIALIN